MMRGSLSLLALLVALALMYSALDAKKCNPKAVKGAAALILDSDVNSATFIDSLAGHCLCTSGASSYARSFYLGEAQKKLANIVEPTLEVNCTDMSQACFVGTNGVPYRALGTITGVKLYSYCDSPKRCKMFANPICAIANDTASGFIGRDRKLTCAKAAKVKRIGKGSKYLKVASISCTPCKGNPIKKAKCKKPFVRASSSNSTNAPGVEPPVTPAPVCMSSVASPSNSAPLIFISGVVNATVDGTAVATSTCQNGYQRTSFSSVSTSTWASATPSVSLNCSKALDICLYDSLGNRYWINVGRVRYINLYSYCDSPSSCAVYAVPICGPDFDPSDGLYLNDGDAAINKTLSCKKAEKNPTLGMSSKFLKISAIACNNCDPGYAPCSCGAT